MKLRINWTVAPTALFLLAALSGACGSDNGSANGRQLKVVTSTGLLADIVANVAGEAASVESVVPANADAHTFSLTPGDARKIADADVVFLVGADFSPAEVEIQRLAEGTVVFVADDLPLVPFQDGGGTDPHFWMDPRLVSAATEVLESTLAGADPDQAGEYAVRADAYRLELAALDSELEDSFRTGEDGSRPVLVTFHDAFGYLARRYDLTILGFVVEGPEEEPSAADIADLVEAMKQEGATVIYKEPQFDSRAVAQVAQEAGAEIRDIPSGALADDYPTYVAMMRVVAEAITE